MKALKNAAVSEAEADAENKRPPVGDTCLLPGDAFTSGVRWYVVYTNIKCETRAAEGLQAKGYLVFIPRYRPRLRRFRRGKVLLGDGRRLAFPRYVLIGVREGMGLYGVRGTDGVEALLCDGVVPAEVGRGVVEDLVFAVDTGLLDETNEHGGPAGAWVSPGEEVEITDGAFIGHYGLVGAVSRAAAEVCIPIFGRATVVHIPLDLLKVAR